MFVFTNEEHVVLRALFHGQTMKQAAPLVGWTYQKIRRRMEELYERHDCSTLVQFTYKVMKHQQKQIEWMKLK